jgi:hypothetical protein
MGITSSRLAGGRRAPAGITGDERPHRPGDPRHDLDLASYGVVAVLNEGHGTRYPGMPWEPKRLFDTLATRYGAPRGAAQASSWPENRRSQ